MRFDAIWRGVVAGLALVALQYAIAFLAPLEDKPELIRWVVSANRVLSIAAYVVAGAVAGAYARIGGAVHGIVAGFALAVLGRVLGSIVTYAAYGAAALSSTMKAEVAMAGWLVLMLFVAAFAGHFGAGAAQRRQLPPA